MAAREPAPEGLGPGTWGKRRLAAGDALELRGAETPVIGRFVTQLGRELRTPIQSCETSLLALPGGGASSESEMAEGGFLLHLRGEQCTLSISGGSVESWTSCPGTLSYVGRGHRVAFRCESECLVLSVRFIEEPVWRVLALLFAEQLSRQPGANEPASSLFCSSEASLPARQQLARLVSAAQAEVAGWTVPGVVRDYAKIEAGDDAHTEASPVKEAPPASSGAKLVQDDLMFPDREWDLAGIARRADDIHVAPFKRSGTTWTQMVLYQLLTDDEDLEKIAHMYEFSPYPFYELRILGTSARIDALPSPRVIKSHEPVEQIYGSLGRYIYVARDGMDVVWSAYNHHLQVGNGPVPFDVFFDRFVSEPKWFNEVLGWWRRRNEPNVLFLTYRDLKSDLRGSVARVATFCGIDADAQKLDRVARAASFAHMKKHEAKFDHNEGVHWLLGQRSAGGFLRKGAMAEGGARLTDAQKRRFLETYERILGGTGLRLDR
ncbi:MAG TPA: sulfotransferase domain-containing protein [Polyangiaceae bacterium]